ncbi:MAG: lactate utilization protein C [Alphaproteobacteria bacterium]
MSDAARARILGAIRRSLGREPDGNAVAARLGAHEPGPLPARGRRDAEGRIALFVAMAEEVSASIARVGAPEDVPGAIAAYLGEHNLPAKAARAPDPALDIIPWDARPLLSLRRGPAQADDAAGITGAFAGIAETGTLMLVSGAEHPSTLNFLPDTHIVVVNCGQVVGTYEEGWARLRARDGSMPRTVAFVTGPSRTADIEQTIHLGAHGPRRLHIVLVDGDGGQTNQKP